MAFTAPHTGIGTDWVYDAVKHRYVDMRSGAFVDLNMLNTTSAATTNAISTIEGFLKAQLDEAQDKVTQYSAMRTFLQAVNPDLLASFDAAFAAQKRLGVGHASTDKTTDR